MMPREGYKSITVKQEIYNFFLEEWRAHENEWRMKGVTSFSGFCTKMLYEMMQRIKSGEIEVH